MCIRDSLHSEQRIEPLAQGHAGNYQISLGEKTFDIAGARLEGATLSLRINGQMRHFRSATHPGVVLVHDGRQRLRLQVESVYRRQGGDAAAAEHRIRAPMPGRVVLVQAKPGDTVNAGDVLLVLEAMKMELALKAPRAGIVAELRAQAGDFVEADAVLATLEN